MKKEEIVKLAFSHGVLLTEGMISILEGQSEDKINEYIRERKQELVADAGKQNFTILKNLTEKPRKLGVQDFLTFYLSKYTKMQHIITERIRRDFVSLNKLDAFRKEVYVIGIVRDIKTNEKKIVVLEDMTSTKPIIFERDNFDDLCKEDDVVVIKAISARNLLFGKKIIYPDIPMRTPYIGSGKACFISDLHLEEASQKDLELFFQFFQKQDVRNLFIAGDIAADDNGFENFKNMIKKYCALKTVFIIPGNMDKNKQGGQEEEYPYLPMSFSGFDNIVTLSNPAIVEVNGLKILMIHKFDISFLRKRYLGKPSKIRVILPEDYLVLDIVPDIVHYGHSHEPMISNYKSITLVNSGSLLSSFKPVIIDFSTREAEQIDLEL